MLWIVVSLAALGQMCLYMSFGYGMEQIQAFWVLGLYEVPETNLLGAQANRIF
jgi:hypothetical protein